MAQRFHRFFLSFFFSPPVSQQKTSYMENLFRADYNWQQQQFSDKWENFNLVLYKMVL